MRIPFVHGDKGKTSVLQTGGGASVPKDQFQMCYSVCWAFGAVTKKLKQMSSTSLAYKTFRFLYKNTVKISRTFMTSHFGFIRFGRQTSKFHSQLCLYSKLEDKQGFRLNLKAKYNFNCVIKLCPHFSENRDSFVLFFFSI